MSHLARSPWFLRAAAGAGSIFLNALGAYGFLKMGILSVLVNTFAPLPLFLIGLHQGAVGAVGAVLIGCFLSLVFFGGKFAFAYGAVQGIPLGVLVYYTLLHRQEGRKVQWYPVSLLIEKGIFLAFWVLLVTGIPYWTGIGDESGKITQLLQEALRKGNQWGSLDNRKISGFLEAAPYFMPVFVTLSWGVNMGVNLVLASKILEKYKASLRPKLEGNDWVLPSRLLYGLAFLSVGTLVAGGVGKVVLSSLAFVVGWGYFISGVAIGHRFCSLFQHERLARFFLYGGMLILVWPLGVVWIVGLLNFWTGPWVEKALYQKKKSL